MATRRPTIGVEFEMGVAVLKPGATRVNVDTRALDVDTWQEFHRLPKGFAAQEIFHSCYKKNFSREDVVRMTMAESLRAAGLPAAADIVHLRKEHYGPDFRQENNWWVTGDASIEPEATHLFKDLDWFQMELNSPALMWFPEALATIRSAVETLTANFLINSGDTCGLHVHVGYGQEGYQLQSLKDIMSFLWCFEPQITTIHPERRMHTIYASCLQEGSIIAQTWGELHEMRVRPEEAVAIIQSTKSINDLITECHGDGGLNEMVYRFSQLRIRPNGMPQEPFKRTVEFRQHAASLEFPRVEAWINTVVGIVELCVATSGTHWLRSFIDRQCNPETRINLVELLRLIGLQKESEFYAQNPGSVFSRSGRKRDPAGTDETDSDSAGESGGSNASWDDGFAGFLPKEELLERMAELEAEDEIHHPSM